MPDALRSVVSGVDCELLVLSYNDESWLAVEELETLCGQGRSVATLAFDSARYVGARIGIFDPSGVKVGRVSHLSNQELLVIAGEGALVRRVVDAVGRLGSASGVVEQRPQRRSTKGIVGKAARGPSGGAGGGAGGGADGGVGGSPDSSPLPDATVSATSGPNPNSEDRLQ
jgi:hypothetical protein